MGTKTGYTTLQAQKFPFPKENISMEKSGEKRCYRKIGTSVLPICQVRGDVFSAIILSSCNSVLTTVLLGSGSYHHLHFFFKDILFF